LKERKTVRVSTRIPNYCRRKLNRFKRCKNRREYPRQPQL